MFLILIYSLSYECIVPFKNDGKGSYSSSGEGMAIDHQNIMAHAPVEGDLGDDIHAGIAELQGDHGQIWLAPLHEAAKAG